MIKRARGTRVGLPTAVWGTIAVAMLTGCSAAISPSVIADAQTAARVKTALVNDPVVGGLTIEVQVIGGVVTLSGRVRSQSDVERAVGLARAVAGVSDVTTDLQVGGDVSAAPAASTARDASVAPEELEPDPAPSLLAVGASMRWSSPRLDMFEGEVSIGPLIKIGTSQGLGPAVAFDWYRAQLESIGGSATLAKVRVRPVMVGMGYTLVDGRFSVTPSIVGGYAFNSLSITGTGDATGLPVEVANSFAWRVGASAWYDASRRVAINASTGYLMTPLRLTVVERGELRRFRASGDTLLLRVGVAYKVF